MLDPKTKPGGYDELMQKLLPRGTPARPPLRGLTHEQVVLAMPDEILRILPDDFIQSLPVQVQHAIRERLGRRG